MIQPGQIDYLKQLNSLKNLPASKESVQYLTGLLRNPSSPFEKFLIDGRLQQLTKALENQAGTQAQDASPKGTITDSIEQAAGLAALQSAQQRQAAEQMQQQAGQAQMPVPQGITQPQAQPEAEGGVASAPVDSEMFNFAPGGIVAFANDVKEKKQLVKDEDEERLKKQTEMYVLAAQEAAKKREADAPVKELPTEESAMGMSTGPAKVNPLSRMLLDPLKAAASGISGLMSRPTSPPPALMFDRPEGSTNAPAVDLETQKLARLAANPQAAQNTNPALQPNVAPPPPPAVNTGINTGKPPAPAAPAGPPTGIAATLEALKNMPQQAAFNKSIEDARESVQGTTREQKLKDELDLQKALGIGTFEKQQQQMYEENKARKDKIDAGRGQRDLFAQLAAYSRPGANWSQVVERDIASKSAALMEDEQFANSQNKLLTDIQRTAEERRVGTASSIRAAEATEKKTKQEMLHYIMQSQGTNLQVAEKILGDTLQAQVQMRSQDKQYEVGMANANSRNERLAFDKERQMLRFDQTVKQMEARNQDLLNKNPDYKGYVKMRQGLEQQLTYLKDEAQIAKKQEQIDGYNQKIADLSTKIIGGGGISTLPTSVPPPGAVREVKK
jgi:hypothetical protein